MLFHTTSHENTQKHLTTFVVCTTALVLMCLYAARQFSGLTSPESMEYAQIARNLSEGKGLTTLLMRPIACWYLTRNETNSTVALQQQDVLHGPVYPAVLAGGFLLAGPPSDTGGPGEMIYPPEKWVIVPLGVLFTFATGIMVFRLGTMLFSRRIGFFAMLVYLSCETVLAGSISGGPVPLTTFLLTASFYAIMAAVIRLRSVPHEKGGYAPIVLSAVFCALAFLTRYSTLAVVPVFILFIIIAMKRKVILPLALWLFFFLVLAAPWCVRKVMVSGDPFGLFGLAPYTALSDSSIFPSNTFERERNPDIDISLVLRVIDMKLGSNFGRLYDADLRLLGSGFVICFFFVSFLYRFVLDEAHLFRWSLLLGIVVMLAAACAYGQGVREMLAVFLPMIVLFGIAFLFLMINRMELNDPFTETAIALLVLILTAVPAVLSTLGPLPARSLAQSPRAIQYLCNLVPKSRTICTDIPWATAWYAGHPSLLLPLTVDDMRKMDGTDVGIGGLYLTPETGRTSYSDMVTLPEYRSWLPIINGWLPPDEFPLTEAIKFPSGRRDRIFLYRPLAGLPASAFSNAASNAGSD